MNELEDLTARHRRHDAVINTLALLVVVAVMGAACALLTTGCHTQYDPLPPTPADVPAGACQAAQDTLEELDCPEATTPAGTPFVVACEDAAADGRNFCPIAISKVTRCSDVERAAAGEWGCP